MSDTTTGTTRAAALLSGLVLATAVTAALAQDQTWEETLQIEAMAHADTIELAYRALEVHIERQSSAATSWGGSTPPAATGWDPDWTARGLGGRYCDDVLVVFAARPTLKGVGANQRSVRMAPHVRAVREGRVYPPLHWLANGVAEGDLGRATLTLPACMTSLPLDRVGLAGRVVDPWSVTNQKIVRRESEDRVCPSGQHGAGQTWERPWTREFNGRGEAVGTEIAGSWGIKVDRCRDDYTVAELYTVVCPSGTGDQVWRRHRTVTSAGETFTVDPTPVSNICTISSPPTPPTAVTNAWTSISYEYRTTDCPFTHTGSGRQERRTVTQSYESTEWPWDPTPTQRLVNVDYSNWIASADNCVMVVAGGPGDPNTGIDVDGDGRSDYGTVAEAVAAGVSPADMSIGVGDGSTGTKPNQSGGNQGGNQGINTGGPTGHGRPGGGHPGGGPPGGGGGNSGGGRPGGPGGPNR